ERRDRSPRAISYACHFSRYDSSSTFPASRSRRSAERYRMGAPPMRRGITRHRHPAPPPRRPGRHVGGPLGTELSMPLGLFGAFSARSGGREGPARTAKPPSTGTRKGFPLPREEAILWVQVAISQPSVPGDPAPGANFGHCSKSVPKRKLVRGQGESPGGGRDDCAPPGHAARYWGTPSPESLECPAVDRPASSNPFRVRRIS